MLGGPFGAANAVILSLYFPLYLPSVRPQILIPVCRTSSCQHCLGHISPILNDLAMTSEIFTIATQALAW